LVADSGSHTVDPGDEQRHLPGADPLWNESYYLDFVAEDGAIAGYVRIGLYPNLGVTWWTTMLVGADRPVTASVAFDLPVGDGTGLALRSPGFDVTALVEDPLTLMTVRGTAPAVTHLDPAAVYRGEPGEPTTVGFDLIWTTDGRPYHYDITTRYEVPCLVRGEVTIGGERLVVSGHGQRDHSWGVRDWWAFGWCWASARLDDGTRVHLVDVRTPGTSVAFGYVQPGDGLVHTVERLEVSEVVGDEGLPLAAEARLEPVGLELEIEPVAFGPLLLVAPDGRTSRFPRASAKFATRDGRSGTGWIEWNQPDQAMADR
jgi:hypothetical protein